MSKHILGSAQKTQELAQSILKDLENKKSRRNEALVFALVGELGAGKTTFVQGIAKYLSIKRNATSPTFVLMKKYKLQNQSFETMYHFDCYRINSAEEILDLDWGDIITNKNNLILVEWAERIKDAIPRDAVWVYFTNKGGNKREIEIKKQVLDV